MSEINIPELRETIFHLCLERYEGRFHSGQTANNKLELEWVAFLPALRDKVARGVAGLLAEHDPDLIVSTPHGGDWLATRVGCELDAPSLLLAKDANGQFLHTSGGREIAETSQRPAAVDDLFNERGSVLKVLAMPGIGEKAVAAAAIVDRNPGAHSNLGIPHRALIEEDIPPILTSDDPRWGYAD